MKNLRTKLSYTLLVAVFLSSCDREPTYTKRFVVSTSVDDNWTTSLIECDSVNMISQNHITVFVDGLKSDIYAGQIKVHSNPSYKPNGN